jgi:hypothetical protein
MYKITATTFKALTRTAAVIIVQAAKMTMNNPYLYSGEKYKGMIKMLMRMEKTINHLSVKLKWREAALFAKINAKARAVNVNRSNAAGKINNQNARNGFICWMILQVSNSCLNGPLFALSHVPMNLLQHVVLQHFSYLARQDTPLQHNW